MDELPIRRALISVSDTSGLNDFAHALVKQGIEILATTSTAKFLRQHNLAVTDVSSYTGFPEILDGRVKTLHPKIHGGIVARRHHDEATLQQHDILSIDLVVVNLYPFEKTITQASCQLPQAIENIDIGGPSLLRAAAKNHAFVTVIVEPNDYTLVLNEIQTQDGKTTSATRLNLAKKVFTHTAYYDALISNYLADFTSEEQFPELYVMGVRKKYNLRYGENPQQAAAFYSEPQTPAASISNAQLLQGKELSFNNIVDADAAYACVKSFATQPACVIVKHANPCGVAIGKTCLDAYQRAYSSDSTSAFGGIIAINQELDHVLANTIITQQFVEVIIAPSVTANALELLQQKPALRLLTTAFTTKDKAHLDLKRVSGGLLIQQDDTQLFQHLTVVTKRTPTTAEQQELLFAWQVAKFVKSNAIVCSKNLQTVGIGAGQTSRVVSTRLALQQAKTFGFDTANAVLASDAFPFADTVEIAAAAGISAIIQPGGGKRDAEVIAAANAANIAMIFTGTRHFRH